MSCELKDKISTLNPMDSTWGVMYRELACFVRKHGHAWVPAGQGHEVLKDWLNRQVLNKRLLSEREVQLLDGLGIYWGHSINKEQEWDLMFSKLKDFHKEYGHCRVTKNPANDQALALWVLAQRRVHSENRMREDRLRKLNDLGFCWNIQKQYDLQWEGFFLELAAYQRKYGHCRVSGQQEKLVAWMERQRLNRKKNLLPQDRETKLDAIDFDWSFDEIRKKCWDEKYRELYRYRKTKGHSLVPVNCKINPSLGTWVASQRWLEAKGKLKAQKKMQLDKLDFVWSTDTGRILKSEYDAIWETKFEKLKNYRQLHGTCQVSLKKDPALQSWTCWQRKMFYQGQLASERIDRLNEICFPWSIQEGYWMKMYDDLVKFHKQFGHSRVPLQWEANLQLARWVCRIKKSRRSLGAQKVELLNLIGFDWTYSPKTIESWEHMYNRLVAFQQAQGHTRVPVQWTQDVKLGKWVSRMRYEKEKMAKERRTLLIAIRFEWGRRPGGEKQENLQTFDVLAA